MGRNKESKTPVRIHQANTFWHKRVILQMEDVTNFLCELARGSSLIHLKTTYFLV